MIALAHATRLVAVPTLDALAHNAPADVPRVGVGLNLKRDRLWSAVYERQDDRVVAAGEPGLHTLEELLAQAEGDRPLPLLGEAWPEVPAALTGRVAKLDATLSRVRAAAVWQVGRQRANAGAFVEPGALTPLYARRPEAVEKWQRLHGTPHGT